MALIYCPACGHKVSQYATSCPRCGQPLQPQQYNQNNQHQQGGYYGQGPTQSPKRNNTALIIMLTAAVCLALFAGLIAAMKGCDNNGNSGSSTSPPTQNVPTTQPTDTVAKTPRDTIHDTVFIPQKEKKIIKVKERETPRITKTDRNTNYDNIDNVNYDNDDNAYYDSSDDYDDSVGLHLSLSGTFHTDNNSILILNGTHGRFTSYEHKNRTVKLDSYDPVSGHLVLRAYSSKGDYLGNFDGTLNGNNYQGTFEHTNGKIREFHYY